MSVFVIIHLKATCNSDFSLLFQFTFYLPGSIVNFNTSKSFWNFIYLLQVETTCGQKGWDCWHSELGCNARATGHLSMTMICALLLTLATMTIRMSSQLMLNPYFSILIQICTNLIIHFIFQAIFHIFKLINILCLVFNFLIF